MNDGNICPFFPALPLALVECLSCTLWETLLASRSRISLRYDVTCGVRNGSAGKASLICRAIAAVRAANLLLVSNCSRHATCMIPGIIHSTNTIFNYSINRRREPAGRAWHTSHSIELSCCACLRAVARGLVDSASGERGNTGQIGRFSHSSYTKYGKYQEVLNTYLHHVLV